MRAGRSDAEIHAFMTERYGDFVLLRPPVTPRTWLLWAAPALFLAGGLGVVFVVVRRRASAARANPASLDEGPDARDRIHRDLRGLLAAAIVPARVAAAAPRRTGMQRLRAPASRRRSSRPPCPSPHS